MFHTTDQIENAWVAADKAITGMGVRIKYDRVFETICWPIERLQRLLHMPLRDWSYTQAHNMSAVWQIAWMGRRLCYVSLLELAGMYSGPVSFTGLDQPR